MERRYAFMFWNHHEYPIRCAWIMAAFIGLCGDPAMGGDTTRFDIGFTDTDVFFADLNAGETPTNARYVDTSDPGRYLSGVGWSNVDVDICWNPGADYTGYASEVYFCMDFKLYGTNGWYLIGSPFSGDYSGSDRPGECSNRQALDEQQYSLVEFTCSVPDRGLVGTGMCSNWTDDTGLRHSEVNTADFFFILAPEVPIGCDTASEPCNRSHAEPGCDDIACCVLVCDADAGGDPFCCDDEWDETCVDLAVELCGAYVYSCEEPGYVNDCASSPMVVLNGEVIAFDTTGANTDGPGESDCNSTKNDLQIWSDLWYLVDVDAASQFTATCCNLVEFDTKIAIYDIGADDSEFDPQDLPDLFIACNEDCEDVYYSSELYVPCLDAGRYLVRLGGYQGASGPGDLVIRWEEILPPDSSDRCDRPGPDVVTQTIEGSRLQAIGVSCNANGISTDNAFARVYTTNEIGEDFTLDCVTFGIANSGSNVDASINIYRSADGNPGGPFDDLELIGSMPYAFYTTDGPEFDSVEFVGGLDIELEPGAALVVELQVKPSCDGFATFAGGTSADVTNGSTWVRTDACGISDFLSFDDIDLDVQWFVDLNGTAGGRVDCPGDIDGDGSVGGSDLGVWLTQAGTICEADDPCLADLDGDGEVRGSDLGLLLVAWGPCDP